MGGLILDSSVSIRAERQKLTITELFDRIRAVTPEERVGLTAIGVTELFHGIYRADSVARANHRREFLEGLLTRLPVFDYTLPIAEFVGRIDGEQTRIGNIIPNVDLMIGGAALYHGFSVLTANPRDFRKIPGLDVIAFT